MPPAVTFYSLMRKAREAADLSRQEIADTLGVSKPFLCNLENGVRFPSPRLSKKIAETLNLDVEQFARLVVQARASARVTHLTDRLVAKERAEAERYNVTVSRRDRKGTHRELAG